MEGKLLAKKSKWIDETLTLGIMVSVSQWNDSNPDTADVSVKSNRKDEIPSTQM